jgi:hypothetical protein
MEYFEHFRRENVKCFESIAIKYSMTITLIDYYLNKSKHNFSLY